jgi:hypothetical protein
VLRILLVSGFPVFPVVANTWDSTFYDEAATSLAQGEGYRFQNKPTAFFPPGFPVALAAAYRVGGAEPRTGQVLNLLLSVLLGLTLVALVGAVAGGEAARWTLAVVALEPSQILMPAFLMSEVLCALAILAFLLALERRGRGGGAGWILLAAAAGLVGGMTRGHAFLLVGAIPLLLVYARRLPRRSTLVTWGVALAVCVTGIGLWAARNQREMGKPIPVATNGGINLLLGNNPNALGGRADPPGGVPQTGNEVLDERIATDRALEYVRTHPGRTLAMIPLKAARLWLVGPAVTYRTELRTKIDDGLGLAMAGAAQLSHLLVLGATLVLLLRHRRDPGPAGDWAVLLGTVAAVWTLGHLPFLGGARYLFPIHPLLLGATGILLGGVRSRAAGSPGGVVLTPTGGAPTVSR